MTAPRPRPRSPDNDNDNNINGEHRDHDRDDLEGQQPAKRLKMFHPTNGAADPTPCFAAGLFDEQNIQFLRKEYLAVSPFKHALVPRLFRDDLLLKVKDECLSELSFVEKETDIYKVHQTGDLASLSFLTDAQISRLQNLRALRDALYSKTFRSWIQQVTGCGPLSGTKTDMSVTTYRKGCHLLNHDDVIGTRRVSYILYMPLPQIQGWQKDWGGALELYPVKKNASGVLEPEPVPEKSIPPCWNQFILFEVQPGRSFHSVEEVIVGEGEDGRERMSISGWFHSAQPDEEGYEPEAEPELKSSREQLASSSTIFKDYPENSEAPLPDVPLADEHISFLSKFLNPVYLRIKTLQALMSRFADESSLELYSFLSDPLLSDLENSFRTRDDLDGLGRARRGRIPPHTAGTSNNSKIWKIRGPPHKARYCVLAPPTDEPKSIASTFECADPPAQAGYSDDVMRRLQDELFPSPAFRAWLTLVTSLVPMRYAVEARRFRPGLDYTLAVSEEKEARLDVVLGLTPNASAGANYAGAAAGQSTMKTKKGEEPRYGWETGLWGGWECYMAPHEGDDDPAVYKSGPAKKAPSESNHPTTNGTSTTTPSKPIPSNGHAHAPASPSHSHSAHSPSVNGSNADEDDTMVDGNESSEEDGTLLTVQPGFNRLLLVLRDEGVMHFVKYVSAAAEGSRWDVCAEYEVGMVAEVEE